MREELKMVSQRFSPEETRRKGGKVQERGPTTRANNADTTVEPLSTRGALEYLNLARGRPWQAFGLVSLEHSRDSLYRCGTAPE